MTYPAFASLFADPDRTPALVCVWMAIQPPHLDFVQPRALKVDAVASAARVSTGSAAEAIKWLIARGYLIVHEEDGRGVRSVTIAYAVPTKAAVA